MMFKCPHCGQPVELEVVCATEPARPVEKQVVEPASNIREALNRMDDAELNGFAMENFSRVFDKFSRGMQRDEKINLLLDYHRRQGDDYAQLKTALQRDGWLR